MRTVRALPAVALVLPVLMTSPARAAAPAAHRPLHVAVAASPRPMAVGQRLTLTVTVVNSSRRTVAGPTLDALATSPATGPLGFRSRDCRPSDGAGGHYLCRLSTLRPGARQVVHLTTAVHGAEPGTKVFLEARVLDGRGAPLSNAAQTRVRVAAD